RNFQLYYAMLLKFWSEMNLTSSMHFVATKMQNQRKLAREIRDWYENRLENNFLGSIRDSAVGEEAMVLGQSVLEYKPDSTLADDYRTLWQRLKKIAESKRREELGQTDLAAITKGTQSNVDNRIV